MPWSAESGSYLVSVATRSLDAASDVQALGESLRGPEGAARQARPGRPGWFTARCWLARAEWAHAVSLLSASDADALVCVEEPAGRLTLGLFAADGWQWTSITRTSLRPLRDVVTGRPLFGPPIEGEPWPLARRTIEAWLARVGLPQRGSRRRVMDRLDRFADRTESGLSETLMQILGVVSADDADGLRPWQGAVGYWLYPSARMVGRRRLEMGFQDWFAGQTAQGLALWSREHGREPAETAPADAESTARFGRVVQERVITPELDATTFDGHRYWTTHQPPASPCAVPGDPVRLVAHISPHRALAVFVALPEVVTTRIFAPGQPLLVDRLWPSGPQDGGATRHQLALDLLPGDDDTELLRVAGLTLRSGRTDEWQAVPVAVAPTLPATCDFARNA